mgnify:CR=1 FL=1
MSGNMAFFYSGVMIEMVYGFAAIANYYYLDANSALCDGVGSDILKELCDDVHKTNWILVAVATWIAIFCFLLAKVKKPGKCTVCSFVFFLIVSVALTVVPIGIEAKDQYDRSNKYVSSYMLQVLQFCAIWYVPVLVRFGLLACTVPKLRSVIRGTDRPFEGYRPLLG